jgi:Rps23 Pro-64 3,4-dihydroxylase Tpa1-like proline 4-hydroxylase
MSSLFSAEFSKRLAVLAAQHASTYQAAEPFPHIVMDDFLPREIAEAVVRAYPEPESLDWIRFENEREKKLAYSEIQEFPEPIREVMQFLNSPSLLRFLETLTGIPALIPDPYLVGGGMHQIRRGGHLGIHVDFNKHRVFQLDRRLNLLIYLNQDWDEAWGGHFEMWTRDMSGCVNRVAPLFNRCVVFTTSEASYHGHPHPLRCPPERTRRSLATYYFTNGRPESEAAPKHSTVFRDPYADLSTAGRGWAALKRAARDFIPPILMRAVTRRRGA